MCATSPRNARGSLGQLLFYASSGCSLCRRRFAARMQIPTLPVVRLIVRVGKCHGLVNACGIVICMLLKCLSRALAPDCAHKSVHFPVIVSEALYEHRTRNCPRAMGVLSLAAHRIVFVFCFPLGQGFLRHGRSNPIHSCRQCINSSRSQSSPADLGCRS